MSDSIGLGMNIYEEANALPGALECASKFFDDIWVVHAGPGGKKSTDGTLEILEKWGVRVIFDQIDDGFGALRTRVLRAATTEWTMIMDADERFFPVVCEYVCNGYERYPDVQVPNLSVGIRHPAYNQGDLLRRKLTEDCRNADAFRMSRRHWFTTGMNRPCQDWDVYQDWQLRCLRNKPNIMYDTGVRMHERLRDMNTGQDPSFCSGNTVQGPYFDHFHLHFKAMEPEQRQHDIKIYDALHYGRPIPSE